ncbi:hypothetical protein CsSME_00033136 [Camellia sinensis var. sinensis]
MTKPWLIAGDFNDISGHNERRSFSQSYHSGQSCKFLGQINRCGLMDLGCTGSKFTWTNNKKKLANTMERLDRALCNTEWRTLVPEGTVRNLSLGLTLTTLPSLSTRKGHGRSSGGLGCSSGERRKTWRWLLSMVARAEGYDRMCGAWPLERRVRPHVRPGLETWFASFCMLDSLDTLREEVTRHLNPVTNPEVSLSLNAVFFCQPLRVQALYKAIHFVKLL